MLKSLLSIAVILLLVKIQASAQSTVTFDDETTMELEGTLMGTYNKFSYTNTDEVEIIEYAYYKFDDDTIQITIHGEYIDHTLDDLRIYRIHKNQINFDELELKEETDVDGRFLVYSLNFSALETEFNYTSYSSGNSTGDKLSFSYFNLNSDKIEGLEAFEHLITIY